MKNLLLFFTMLSMLLVGCSEESENIKQPSDEPVADEPFENTVVVPVPELSASEYTAAKCQGTFGVKFFKAANKNHTGKSMLVSPLSASLLVSMVANSTDNDLSTSISRVLGCEDVEALNSLSKKYMEWLPKVDKDVTVGIANSLWYSNRYTLNPAFASAATDSYASELFGRDFIKAKDLIDEINLWTSRNTRGKIDEILSFIHADLKAIYINALYFRGYWYSGFNEKLTKPLVFHGFSGNYETDMMGQESLFNYYSDEAGTVVELPFGKGRNCSILLLLPAENTDIDSFIASDSFDMLLSAKRESEIVAIRLPKFRIEPDDEIELTEILEGLGMSGIGDFRQSCLFTEMIEGRLEVLQKTRISLDEDGVEAAAASWTGLFGSSGEEPSEPKNVIFDRPFAFLIMENNTGLSLFAGKVVDIKR